MTDSTTTPAEPAPRLGVRLADLAERAIWTFLQVLLTGVLASGYLATNDTRMAVAAGVAAALSVLTAGLPQSVGLGLWGDTLYRALRTYAVAFVAVLVADPQIIYSADGWHAAAWAALPAGLAVVKGAAASVVGTSSSAATLPARLDPTTYPAAA